MTEAVNKLNAEMEKVKSSYVQIVGKFLLEHLKLNPSVAEQIMQEGKTISGSLEEMRKEAEKQKVGDVAVLSDEEGFAVVLKYFGIEGEIVAPATEPVQIKKAESATAKTSETPTEFNVSLEDLLK